MMLLEDVSLRTAFSWIFFLPPEPPFVPLVTREPPASPGGLRRPLDASRCSPSGIAIMRALPFHLVRPAPKSSPFFYFTIGCTLPRRILSFTFSTTVSIQVRCVSAQMQIDFFHLAGFFFFFFCWCDSQMCFPFFLPICIIFPKEAK